MPRRHLCRAHGCHEGPASAQFYAAFLRACGKRWRTTARGRSVCLLPGRGPHAARRQRGRPYPPSPARAGTGQVRRPRHRTCKQQRLAAGDEGRSRYAKRKSGDAHKSGCAGSSNAGHERRATSDERRATENQASSSTSAEAITRGGISRRSQSTNTTVAACRCPGRRMGSSLTSRPTGHERHRTHRMHGTRQAVGPPGLGPSTPESMR
jgi:hypothetical protein